jgi:hypothetical protein
MSGLLSQAIIGAGGAPRLPAIASSWISFWSAFISPGESNFSRIGVSFCFSIAPALRIHPIGHYDHRHNGIT